MSTYRLKISIPEWLDKILFAPLLLARRIWYGYAFRRIPLINSSKYAIVDPPDYYELAKYTWWAHKRKDSYNVLRFTEEGACFRPVFMHRDVMRLKMSAESCLSRRSEAKGDTIPAGFVIDHIDRNGLNNTRANLRLATHSQNNMNKFLAKGSSKYKGVSFRRDIKRWKGSISFKGKKLHLGFFESEIDAAKAYDKAAKKYFGEFAYLNFPPQKKLKGLKDKIKVIMNSKFLILNGKGYSKSRIQN